MGAHIPSGLRSGHGTQLMHGRYWKSPSNSKHGGLAYYKCRSRGVSMPISVSKISEERRIPMANKIRKKSAETKVAHVDTMHQASAKEKRFLVRLFASITLVNTYWTVSGRCTNTKRACVTQSGERKSQQ